MTEPATYHQAAAASHGCVRRSSSNAFRVEVRFQPNNRLKNPLRRRIRWSRVADGDVAGVGPRPHGGGAGDFAGDLVSLHRTQSFILMWQILIRQPHKGET